MQKTKSIINETIRDERIIKKLKILLLVALLIIAVIYFLLKVVYEGESFTITLDENLNKKTGLIMYEQVQKKEEKKILKTGEIDFLDNITEAWIPSNIHEQAEGAHNGQNYIAYTFYLENKGVDEINYWYTTIIDDVIKDVDEAVRVKIYLNGDSTVYAKKSKSTGEAEENTVEFFSDRYVETEQRKGMKPGERDKITIVIWIEGNDPECLDNLIGGEIKMHMEITEEHI